MSGSISIGGVSVGLGDTKKPDSVQSFGTSGVDGIGGEWNLFADAPGASFRYQPSGFEEKKGEINQIAENSHMNGQGSGMASHKPIQPLSSAATIFASLVA